MRSCIQFIKVITAAFLLSIFFVQPSFASNSKVQLCSGNNQKFVEVPLEPSVGEFNGKPAMTFYPYDLIGKKITAVFINVWPAPNAPVTAFTFQSGFHKVDGDWTQNYWTSVIEPGAKIISETNGAFTYNWIKFPQSGSFLMHENFSLIIPNLSSEIFSAGFCFEK